MIHRTFPVATARRARVGLAPALLMFCGVALAAPAQAGPILTLLPTDGALRGMPGETVGWGFKLFSPTGYLVVTSASFSPSALTIGEFTDYISEQYFVVGPADTVTQVFDPVLETGFGAFEIDLFASIGDLAAGRLTLTYDLFSRNPEEFPDDNDITSYGNELSVEVSVGVPAPAPLLLVLTGLLGFLRWRRSDVLHAARPR